MIATIFGMKLSRACLPEVIETMAECANFPQKPALSRMFERL